MQRDSACGNPAIQNRVVYTAADGRRFLVTHGDELDAVALLGTKAYDWLLRLAGPSAMSAPFG